MATSQRQMAWSDGSINARRERQPKSFYVIEETVSEAPDDSHHQCSLSGAELVSS